MERKDDMNPMEELNNFAWLGFMKIVTSEMIEKCEDAKVLEQVLELLRSAAPAEEE